MIKIALDSYPFYLKKNIGPNIFLKRLTEELQNYDCKVTSRFNPFYDIALFAIKNKSFYKKPYVIRIGGIFFDRNDTKFNTLKENKIIFEGIRNSSGVIFISEFTKKLTQKFYKNFDKPNIVIHNSVPLSSFNPRGFNKRNELNIKSKDFVVLVSGTWRRHKRLKEIIIFFKRISKKYQNLKLLILGSVNEREKIKDNDILYAGNINFKFLPDWYRTGNLYMHLPWIDQNANTHVEATACGLPSICSNNGGNKEIIEVCNSGIVSNVDKEYNYDLIDFYNPPEPNFNILEKDFDKIYNNYEKFKSNIKFEPISMRQAAKKYLEFLKEINNLK